MRRVGFAAEPAVPTTPSTNPSQVKVPVPGNHLMVGLLGQRDELLRLVEAAFPDTAIHVRGNEISVDGRRGRAGRRQLFEELVLLLEQGGSRSTPPNIGRTIDMVQADERPSRGAHRPRSSESAQGRMVRPKTSGQKRYVDAIRDNIITFGIGPAGTGKSWLAVAMAVQALQAKQVDRIILTRPAVEAGERLGLPARRPHGQGRPVPAPALRRPLRHGRRRGRAPSSSSGAPSRSRRSPSCAAARSTRASSSSTRRRTPRRSR